MLVQHVCSPIGQTGSAQVHVQALNGNQLSFIWLLWETFNVSMMFFCTFNLVACFVFGCPVFIGGKDIQGSIFPGARHTQVSSRSNRASAETTEQGKHVPEHQHAAIRQQPSTRPHSLVNRGSPAQGSPGAGGHSMRVGGKKTKQSGWKEWLTAGLICGTHWNQVLDVHHAAINRAGAKNKIQAVSLPGTLEISFLVSSTSDTLNSNNNNNNNNSSIEWEPRPRWCESGLRGMAG
eukprot:1142570-Pelagomonas_calceolata.AAC.1